MAIHCLIKTVNVMERHIYPSFSVNEFVFICSKSVLKRLMCYERISLALTL